MSLEFYIDKLNYYPQSYNISHYSIQTSHYDSLANYDSGGKDLGYAILIASLRRENLKRIPFDLCTIIPNFPINEDEDGDNFNMCPYDFDRTELSPLEDHWTRAFVVKLQVRGTMRIFAFNLSVRYPTFSYVAKDQSSYSFVICQGKEGESKIFEWDRPFVASFPCPCCTGIYCLSSPQHLDHIFPDGGPREYRPTLGRLMEMTYELAIIDRPFSRIRELIEAVRAKLNRPISMHLILMPNGIDASFFRMMLLETMSERILENFFPYRLFQILNMPREYSSDALYFSGRRSEVEMLY